MTKGAEALSSAEFTPKSPVERFEDMLVTLEPFLDGEKKIGYRSTAVLQTEEGDACFFVFIPEETSRYSKSITYQTLIKKRSAEGEYLAPLSTQHLKLRHLDTSLGPSRDEDITGGPEKLQALEAALASYEAAARNSGN